MPQATGAEPNNTGDMAQFVMVFVPMLLIMVQGASSERCGPSSIEVVQTNTGENAGSQSDPVFQVTVRNRCKCGVKGVYLHAMGFASSVPVEPKLFRREGTGYLVGDGRRIASHDEVRFHYAWDRAFRMSPVIVQDACS